MLNTRRVAIAKRRKVKHRQVTMRHRPDKLFKICVFEFGRLRH
jgi:hypothetical protein